MTRVHDSPCVPPEPRLGTTALEPSGPDEKRGVRAKVKIKRVQKKGEIKWNPFDETYSN